jgi:hypothetical protein
MAFTAVKQYLKGVIYVRKGYNKLEEVDTNMGYLLLVQKK